METERSAKKCDEAKQSESMILSEDLQTPQTLPQREIHRSSTNFENLPQAEPGPGGLRRNQSEPSSAVQSLECDLSTFEKRSLWLNLAASFIALITLIASVAVGVIFYLQFGEMSRQTVLLQDSLEKARKDSIAAQESQAAQISLLQKQLQQLQYQATQTRNLAQISKFALMTVQRAFVNFDPSIGLTRRLKKMTDDEAYALAFNIPVTNIGNTPTRDFFMTCNAAVLPKTMANDFDFSDRPRLTAAGRTILPPKGKLYCTTPQVPATEIELAESSTTTNQLYLWGWAKYRDVFPGTPTHLTEYCFHLSSWGGDLLSQKGSDTNWTFELCPIHNCTDDECKVSKATPKRKY